MTEQTWKIEKNLCRCCHSEGAFTNLAEPCFNLGEEERYSQMLLESLDVNVAPVTGPLCEVTYTICESCIARLRDACNFKRQVVQCEKQFHDLYNKNVIRFDSCYDIKVEAPESEDEDDLKTDVHLDDFALHSDDDDKKLATDDLLRPKRRLPTKRKPKAKSKTNLRKKLRTVKSEADATKTEAEAETEAQADDTVKQGKEKKGALNPTETEHMNYTTTEDVEGTKYTCNECGFIFKSSYWIKRHMNAEHSNIAALKHRLCSKNTEDDETNVADTVRNPDTDEQKGTQTKEPFKKDCHVCNKTFLNQNRLSIHLRTHKVFKCPECSQMLDQYKLPIHRNEVHGVAIPTCGICGYKNKSQYRINLHQRDVHMKEKNIHCPDCDAKFFNKAELRRHSVRHYQVKKFECNFCTKKFTRLKTLRFHERIHSGDKRMVCRICDERFVQRASLNYHVAKHHPEAV